MFRKRLANTKSRFAQALRARFGEASHDIAANGYIYTVTVSEGGSEAKLGGALELEGFSIRGFAVSDDELTINVAAQPDTWLFGFPDRVSVRMFEISIKIF